MAEMVWRIRDVYEILIFDYNTIVVLLIVPIAADAQLHERRRAKGAFDAICLKKVGVQMEMNL